MSQRNENACGAHNLGEAIPNSYFDYTCDDCMIPNSLEPSDVVYLEHAKRRDYLPDKQKRTAENTKHEKNSKLGRQK